MAYHKREIVKGIFGEFSKIQEEIEELQDAHEQGGKILELVELSDLYGAIEGYLCLHYGMTMEDIKQMSDMTCSSFREGKRK